MRIQALLLTVLSSTITLTAGCGMNTHNYIADKARGFLSEGDSEISALIAKHVGSYQIGSVFPDFLYQCGTNHDNGEFAHWRDFQSLMATHIRSFPKPWSESNEKFVAFSYGVISHYIADLRWHGLNDFFTSEMPFGAGFIRVLGGRNFDMDGGLGDPAHDVADTCGEFVTAKQGKMSYPYNNFMDLETDDIIAVFGMAGRHVNKTSLIECGPLFGSVEFAIRHFVSVIYPVATNPTLCKVYPKVCNMVNAPFLEQRFMDWGVGGVEDNAIFTAKEISRFNGWIVNGPPVPNITNSEMSYLMKPSSGTRAWMDELASLVSATHLNPDASNEPARFFFSPSQTVIDATNTPVAAAPKAPASISRRLSAASRKNVYTGGDSRSYAGASVKACDLDGDGLVNDLIIGSTGANMQDGSVSVFKNGDTSGAPHFTFHGAAGSMGRLGTSIACVDWNKDGVVDIVVGSPSFGMFEATLTGKVSIFSMKAEDVTSNPIYELVLTNEMRLGDVLTVADLDGDGLDEVIIGSDTAATPGSVHACGADRSRRRLLNVTQPDPSHCTPQQGSVIILKRNKDNADVQQIFLWGPHRYSAFGTSISTLKYKGEVILLVGAPQAFDNGAVFLYRGGDLTTAGKSLDPVATIEGENKNDQFGYSISCTTDITDPSYSGLCAIGSPNTDEPHAPKILGIPTRFARLHTGSVTIFSGAIIGAIVANPPSTTPIGLSTLASVAVLRGSNSRSNFGRVLEFGAKGSNGWPVLTVSAPIADVSEYVVLTSFTNGSVHGFCDLKTLRGEVMEADSKSASWILNGLSDRSFLGYSLSHSANGVYASSPIVNDMEGLVELIAYSC